MLRCPPTRIELKYEDGRNELQWARTRAQRTAPESSVRQQRGGATTAATPTAAALSAATVASAAAAARERLGLAARTR